MYAHELPPKNDATRQIPPDVLRSAVLLATAILAVPHEGPNTANLQHKKTLLARLYSFITDANGKYSAPHRSQGVIDAIENGEEVVVEHEHVYPRIAITNRLLQDPSKIEEVLATYLIACLVTQQEHRALSKVAKGLQVEGWARYRAASVIVPGVPETLCNRWPHD